MLQGISSLMALPYYICESNDVQMLVALGIKMDVFVFYFDRGLGGISSLIHPDC